ncbi:MAG: homogentisate 1,2-dioxygenase [Candidatus Zixiibacteriota bacterium]
MPFYHKLGDIPAVKHTTFFKPDGKSLYREELFSSKGFSDVYSNKYHIHLPTKILKYNELDLRKESDWSDAPPMYLHFFTDKKKSDGDFITSRDVFLRNPHCSIMTARPNQHTDNFYRNGYGSEYIFVHHGSGVFKSEFGNIAFGPGDQIIVPRAVTYRLEFDSLDNNKLLIVESDTAWDIPAHYRNQYGQMEEHAPYCERDFRPPTEIDPQDESGEYRIVLKAQERFFEMIVPHHPFDVVGWDGYLFPFAFNIKNFHPKVGRIHLPPPVHLVFTTGHFILCNFNPRPFDFHPEAIPAPYFHSNIDSDEVLYYVEGDFMSRKGVVEGSITHHPGCLPHGPQPGKTEASVGAARTDEYAVMIDTFSPLYPTLNAKEVMDEKYPHSWLE